MPAPNPYQPGGSHPAKLLDGTNATKGLGSFLMVQFLACVPTEMVLHIAVLCFEMGWKTVASHWHMPSSIVSLAVWALFAWFPLAFYAVFSKRVRSGGAAWSGAVGGASFVIGMLIQIMVLAVVPLQVSRWLKSEVPRYMWVGLCVFVSLTSVAILGYFCSKSQASKDSIAK